MSAGRGKRRPIYAIGHTALAAGACVLLATLGCGRPPGAATRASQHRPATPGLTFTIRIVHTPSGGGRSRADSIPMQVRDGVLRVDFPGERAAGGMHRGVSDAYLLVNFTTKTTTVVMPAVEQYWETRFDSAAGRWRRSNTVITDIDVSGSAVGDGGTVNGYATKRYRITTRYTETPSSTAGGQGRKQVQLVEDIWVPDALKDVPDPMQSYLRVFGAQAVGQVVERQAEARRRLFEGLPIRATWELTETLHDGTTASRAWTADFLDLKRADLDPAAFRAPDGYGRIDLGASAKLFDRLLNRDKDTTPGRAKGRKTP